MNRIEAVEYARRWTEAWNRRDIDAVLEHFDEDVVFSSPRALQVEGIPTVHGRAAVREYWRTSLRQVESLHFTLRRVIWDAESSELSIIYDRDVNGQRDRASEVLHFGQSARVVSGEVFYGVIP
jgi:ketosteroid isomerase-like protein